VKREKQNYQLSIPDDDYKMQHVMTEHKKNYESLVKWLYVGANKNNKSYAKIGITNGNLQSRSYSTTDPDYYIFCAFKCNYNISKIDLESIESSVISYLDSIYADALGQSKRLQHAESNMLSECFHGIDFDDLLYQVHYALYTKHLRHFPLGSLTDNYGNHIGDIIDCEFNKIIPLENKMKYMSFLSQ